jgi:hypothetical protein
LSSGRLAPGEAPLVREGVGSGTSMLREGSPPPRTGRGPRGCFRTRAGSCRAHSEIGLPYTHACLAYVKCDGHGVTDGVRRIWPAPPLGAARRVAPS